MKINKPGNPELLAKANINFVCDYCKCEFECNIHECISQRGHDTFGGGFVYRTLSVNCPECGRQLIDRKALTDEQIADTADLGD